MKKSPWAKWNNWAKWDKRNKWVKWFKEPDNKMATINIVILALTLIVTSCFNWGTYNNSQQQLSYFKKTHDLTYEFKLIEKFPEYSQENEQANGEWIMIPYEFTNGNDYEIYYSISWVLKPFNPTTNRLEPTTNTQQLSSNLPLIKRITKNFAVNDSIRTLIGKPQIDEILKERMLMVLSIEINIWDVQGHYPLSIDKVTRTDKRLYISSWTDSGVFSWQQLQ
jgi:hypothetical protein